VMKRGVEPSSRCELIAARAKLRSALKSSQKKDTSTNQRPQIESLVVKSAGMSISAWIQ